MAERELNTKYEMVVFTAPSGAGKTTVFKILFGYQSNGDIIDVHLMLFDKMNQKVHGTFEDILDLYLIGVLLHLDKSCSPKFTECKTSMS